MWIRSKTRVHSSVTVGYTAVSYCTDRYFLGTGWVGWGSVHINDARQKIFQASYRWTFMAQRQWMRLIPAYHNDPEFDLQWWQARKKFKALVIPDKCVWQRLLAVAESVARIGADIAGYCKQDHLLCSMGYISEASTSVWDTWRC